MLKRMLSVALAALLAVGMFTALLTKPVKAAEITEMTISDELVELLKGMEGFAAIPHWDYSQWTVGFGSTCPDEDLERYQKEGIPPEEAHQLLLDQLSEFEKDVNAFMVRNDVQLTQNQFDAMVSFVYNVGASVLRSNDSDVICAVLNGAGGNDFMFAIGQWCSAGGDFLLGLLRRRMMEAYMYLYGTYSTTLPSSFCYVQYDTNGGEYDSRAQGYDSNLAAVPLSVPTREGYIFTGWYTAADGGEKVTQLDASTNGITLYAHWEAGTHTPDTPTDPETGITVTVMGDSVAVRQAAGVTANVISHLYRGEKITITGVTQKNSTLWGYFRKGWVCLDHTNYYEVTGTQRPGDQTVDQNVQVPIKATVLSASGVEVRGGPHSTYPKVGSLQEGTTIMIEEVMTFCNLLWGRYEGGWVRLNQKMLLHDDQVLAHSFVATVNYYYLNVRSGPGTQYSSVTQLSAGDQIEIFAVVIVDGIPWGRFTTGWVYLQRYTDFNIDKLDYYRTHSYGDWYTLGEASCAEPGQQRRDCQHCDHYELQDTPATEHTMGQWYVSKESTCTQAGEERRDCANCAHYETRATALSQHVLGQWYVSKESTCTQAGEERRDCANCDCYETRITALSEHTLGQWYVSKEGTCVQVGEERQDCANCDYYETRQTDLGDHQMGDWTQTVAPGCETVGQEQQKCANCDHAQTREIPAVGHSFGDWYETVAPTQEAEGSARRDCANCQHFETKVLPPDVHVYGQWYVHTEATCAQAGEERRNCTHCDGYESRAIAVKEHSFGDWFVAAAATCAAPGQEKRECTGCDHFETREIAQLEHSFGDWFVSTVATCVTAGQEKRECTGCAHSETRDLGLGDHSLGDWYIHLNPGCETVGEERRACIHCQHYESRQMEALGHSYGDWFVSTAATCATAGQEKRECTGCDHFETRELQKLEHSYGAWHVTTEPTIDTEGQHYRECTGCGAVENGVLPVLPSEERVYATITASSLNVRADASSASSKTGVLYAGLVVQILEQKTVSGKVWGRIEYGWICLTDYTTLKTVREAVVADNGEKTYATLTCNYLSVRPQPTSSAARLATIQNGCRVRIYETTVVGDVTWGRTAIGWIWMTGYVSLETEPGEHTEHTYGDWYVSQAGTCVTLGQERRDCSGCDHYETRDGQLGDHSFGDWFVSKESNCVEAGQEQRNCQLCDHVETRDTGLSDQHEFGQWYLSVMSGCETSGQQCRDCIRCDHFECQEVAPLGHSMGDWYVSVAPTCEATGQQCRDCLNCDHSESKEVAALGHNFGQWYVIKEATVDEEGQQRRDCETCGHYELQQIDKLPSQTGKVYGWFAGTGYLNVREGAGTGYDSVSKLYPNVKVEILEQVDINGVTWGRIEEGWVCITGFIELEYVDGSLKIVTKVYATVTYSYLTIRGGTGSSYTKMGTLNQGDVVEILEIVVVSGKNWGRIAEGWICLTGYASLATATEEVTEGESTRVYATVTNSYLTIRAGTGSSYEKLGTLNQGDVVEIFEIVTVGSNSWGRTSEGWICLTGYTTLATAT